MKDSWKFISNPFYKVAGYKAAGWGILGIVITTAIAYGADVHFHGLLHYGGAPHSEWWCFVVEHLVIWLIPSLLLYIEPVLQSFPCSSDRRSRNSCFFPAAFCFVGFVHDFPTGTAFHVHTVVTGHRGCAIR